MTDPLSTYEAAESEAVERQDEARREQHHAEAAHAARVFICGPMAEFYTTPERAGALIRLAGRTVAPMGAEARVCYDFASDYGLPALLRVIATALEAK